MIIPIGHDKGRRRLPFVTLVIVVACTLLQVHRSVFAPSDEELWQKYDERDQLLQVVAYRLGEDGLVLDPLEVERRNYAGIDEDIVVQLERLDRELDALKQQDLALRFGWSPEQGLSLSLILCAFVHAGWLHLLGNMLFLWLSGAAIEDRWGHLGFGLFYAAAAVAAAGAYGLYNPDTKIIVVGASGAVAGCMGAFLVCYARVKIRFFWWWWMRTGTFEARALYALPIWFAEELLYSYFELSGMKGVAHSAHVGGFVFGALAAAAVKYSGFEDKHLLSLDELAEEWGNKNPELDEGLRFQRSGNKSAALACFNAVLARDPRHATARVHAFELALELREVELARRLAAGGLADMIRDGRGHLVPNAFKQLESMGLHTELSDRTLAEVARVCLGLEAYAPVGVQVVRQLLEAPQPSPLLPGLVWRVAEVQAGAGRGDIAARTLAMLVDRFPMDPFADRARVKLAEAAAAPPS